MMKNHRLSIGIASVAFCATIVFGGGVLFLYVRTTQESAQIKDAETSIAILENKKRQIAVVRQELDTLNHDIERVENTVVSRETFVTFLKSLERLAKIAGVSFRAESATLPQSSKGTGRVHFELKGDYSSITRFILLLDQLPYPGIVEQFIINPLGQNLRATADYVIFNISEQ